MRRIILLAALLAVPAYADQSSVLTARQGGDSVRLTDAPCTNETVLQRLNQGTRADYKAGTSVVDGETFANCWRVIGNSAHLVYEDGDQGLIPLQDLKPELSV